MAELLDSFRRSPKIPADWRAKRQPGATLKAPIHNAKLRVFLQALLPGRWVKVYHYGVDGSEVHYCQHESGKVFDVEYHKA